MRILLLRLAFVFTACTLTVLLPGCVSTGGVYYEGEDYYEPYGFDYGGWGPNYYVVPFHDRDHDHERERLHGGDHRPTTEGGRGRAYRSAPASRPIPSIPSRPRSGGSRSRPAPARK